MPPVSPVRWLSHLRVGQKISLGYVLSLGIAVSGTIAGFVIGTYYHQQAAQRENHTRKEVELLHRLQTGILQMRTHQQQLIPLSQQLKAFEHEYSHMVIHKAEIQHTLAELRTFIKLETPWSGDIHLKDVSKLLQNYSNIPEQYLQEVERLVQVIRGTNLNSPQKIEQSQKLLLSFTNSDLALKFDEMSDELVGLIDQSYKETNEAEALFQQSSIIAQRIVIGSITLSVAIAILLAVLTSKAIAQPIQALTHVAQQSTEESNFDLRASVESDDEIGVLAQSFNQLIHSVQQLLSQQQKANEQLAAYSQTLEQKVEERTRELRTKNSQLQELLEKLHQSQVQIVQSEKMSSLGQLVAGVAHEINNPVNFIHGNLAHIQAYAQDLMNFLHLYQKHHPGPTAEIVAAAEEIDLEFLQTDLPKLLNSMQVGTDRIRQIVLSLRNFSRMDEAEFKPVDIHEGIDSTLLILQHRLKAKAERPEIQVIREYGNLPLVECYAGQLNQVFMNILANAIDALEEQNAKRTYQQQKEAPAQIVIRTSNVKNMEWIEISIIDNGPGMPDQVRQKIFNPFFTTKSIGQGTGMGLPISYQVVVEKHQGQLNCCSTPGEGTTFMIQIPVKQKIATENLE